MKHISALASAVCLCSLLALFGCKEQKLKMGKKFIPTNSQINVLQELTSGTADIGIMDSVMADFYINAGSYKNVLAEVDNISLSDEKYVIAARKDAKDTIARVNEALSHLIKNKRIVSIAAKYGLASELIADKGTIGEDAASFESISDKSDWEYISKKGNIKIGYTVFAPIAYVDSQTNRLIGFDIDLAREAADFLGVEAQFEEINWDAKETELASKNIDLIWNGMTFTEDREKNMAVSIPYLLNRQVAVVRIADKDRYSASNLSEFIKQAENARIAAESGSAGERCIIAVDSL